MRNPNRLITREMAESHIWNYDYQASSNVIDVYIRRLRRKIDDPFEIKLFETVRGAGYRLGLLIEHKLYVLRLVCLATSWLHKTK